MNIRTLAAVFSLVAVLSGCSSAGNAILQTLPYAYGRNPAVDNARLNPDFRYLRVTVGGRVALLALGYLDSRPQGTIEVWYSAEREVLRLQNGRLVGAVGLTTEWRNVVLPELPSWSEAASADRAFRWTRTRDVMPGYRYGVKDHLSLRVIEAPRRSALQSLDPRRLTWFQERDESGSAAALPPARYAAELRGGEETVVYGEQCLAADLCFTWQRWPVMDREQARSHGTMDSESPKGTSFGAQDRSHGIIDREQARSHGIMDSESRKGTSFRAQDRSHDAVGQK